MVFALFAPALMKHRRTSRDLHDMTYLDSTSSHLWIFNSKWLASCEESKLVSKMISPPVFCRACSLLMTRRGLA
jgi:hypothetical protein